MKSEVGLWSIAYSMLTSRVAGHAKTLIIPTAWVRDATGDDSGMSERRPRRLQWYGQMIT
jgi:hypothetical protein